LDISPAALEVARRNADTLGAEVSFLESDGFAALAAQVFDLIVTNPPYIGRSEPLMPEVRDFEPELALFGGVEGDEFLRRLAVEAQGHLVPKGLLITEVGYQQMSHTIGLFEAQGWQLLERVTDLSGIERVAVFSRQ
jgi:release factor glutamine methyltransferase